MKLLPALFQNTPIASDRRRVDSTQVPYSRAVFLGIDMAGSTAAQMAVSRESIERRNLSYWHFVRALNNGSIDICGRETSQRWGADVTGAMERIWHNFFRTSDFIFPSKRLFNDSVRYMQTPLVLPSRKLDYSLPEFLSTMFKSTSGECKLYLRAANASYFLPLFFTTTH